MSLGASVGLRIERVGRYGPGGEVAAVAALQVARRDAVTAEVEVGIRAFRAGLAAGLARQLGLVAGRELGGLVEVPKGFPVFVDTSRNYFLDYFRS